MALSTTHQELLKLKLAKDFVPLLPPLIDKSVSPEKREIKNLSRAFSAFALQGICNISTDLAAASVVDDTNDKGIDAIYYDAATATLYLVQSKLKEGEQFGQKEALEFCEGIVRIIAQDFTDFNDHVLKRRVAIEDAVENCESIRVVVAHIGSGISLHALVPLNNLFDTEKIDEDRLIKPLIDFGPEQVIQHLQQSNAYKVITENVLIHKCATITDPRPTYFGYVMLTDLVQLHAKYGIELYEQNIRNSLGNKTDVNTSIQRTLEESPSDFFYLNNGVTALCKSVKSKGSKAGKAPKKLTATGLSIINGAQTVASAAHLLESKASTDIGAARVTFTLIVVPSKDTFGKSVTRARNHQNPVSIANFAALDDEQERLRRELAQLDIHYVYKRGAIVPQNGVARITIDEAAYALALFQKDPRYAVWLKREPGRFLNTTSDEYKALFSPGLTAHQLVNAVTFYRYAQQRIDTEASIASGSERLIYRHGSHAFAWTLAKRVRDAQQEARLINGEKLSAELSIPVDELRQLLFEQATIRTQDKGPLALFKNQTDVISLLEAVAIAHYDLGQHAAIGPLRNQQQSGQAYPKPLFTFLTAKAPQISNIV